MEVRFVDAQNAEVKRNRVARAHVELKERGDPDVLCDAEIDEYLSWQPLIRLATQVLEEGALNGNPILLKMQSIHRIPRSTNL